MAAAVAPSATDKLAKARLSSAPGATALGLLRPLTSLRSCIARPADFGDLAPAGIALATLMLSFGN